MRFAPRPRCHHTAPHPRLPAFTVAPPLPALTCATARLRSWEGKDAVRQGRSMIGATNPLESKPGSIRYERVPVCRGGEVLLPSSLVCIPGFNGGPVLPPVVPGSCFGVKNWPTVCLACPKRLLKGSACPLMLPNV
eukprot:gene17-biopygen7755